MLTIRDHGPGISAALRPHLFQPFVREAGLTGQGGPAEADHGAGQVSGLAAGAGLGLSICHGLVLALGGGLSLANRPDHRSGAGRVEGLDTVVRLPWVPPDTARD